MAKRKRKTNELSNEKKLKQGRGAGSGENYKPWLHIQDVASRGLSTRIKGIKANRVHHFLSRLELFCFYCFDWSEDVIDIREQYPLDQKETLAIAKMLNIKHPRVPRTLDWVVMTTDFLVTMRQPVGTYETAFSVKYSEEAAHSRTIEKFEIEKFYWTRRGIEWSVITEKNINRTLVQNIEWIHSFSNLNWLLKSFPPSLFQEVADFLLAEIFNGQTPLRRATDSCDKKFNFVAGVSLSIARHLIATRKWRIDMTLPIHPEKPLCFA